MGELQSQGAILSQKQGEQRQRRTPDADLWLPYTQTCACTQTRSLTHTPVHARRHVTKPSLTEWQHLVPGESKAWPFTSQKLLDSRPSRDTHGADSQDEPRSRLPLLERKFQETQGIVSIWPGEAGVSRTPAVPHKSQSLHG